MSENQPRRKWEMAEDVNRMHNNSEFRSPNSQFTKPPYTITEKALGQGK
jgi:hypothetical protein